jgi:uncharacterized membrane protein YbhN (UPF0104 family)
LAQIERAPAVTDRRKRAFWLVIRLGVAAGALAWTLSSLALEDIVRAASDIPASAFVAAVGLFLLGIWIGSIRWRILMAGYGAVQVPSLFLLFRIGLIGAFYNTFLPGAVGGDILRGHVTRRAFEGVTGGYMVVLLDRIFGLTGLLLLSATVSTLYPIGDTAGLGVLSVLGMLAALAIALFPFVGRRLAPRLPGLLSRLAASLPVVRHPAPLAWAVALSVATHTVGALIGHVLLAPIAPEVALTTSLALVPLALVANFFPFTVAGLGVREAAFVIVFGEVGVEREVAVAASLAFLTAQMITALIGGIAHLVAPVELEPTPVT